MTVFGGMYYIVPRLLGMEGDAWCPKLLKAHFLPYDHRHADFLSRVAGRRRRAGGFDWQGRGQFFTQVMRGTLMPLRMSTLGDPDVSCGNASFSCSIFRMWARRGAGSIANASPRYAEGGQMNNGPLLFLGLFAAMVCSWLGFVMAPQLQIGNLPQTNTVVVGDAIAQTYPLAPPGDGASRRGSLSRQWLRRLPYADGPPVGNWGRTSRTAGERAAAWPRIIFLISR